MDPLPPRLVGLALLAGALWGAIGCLLAGPMLGPAVWGGLAVSPGVGLAVAFVFRGFRGHPPGRRIGLSLVSLYLGAGLFALAAGIADAARPMAGRDALAVVIQSVLGVWWGVTYTGYLALLWPLAYLTHTLLGRVGRRPGSGRAGG